MHLEVFLSRWRCGTIVAHWPLVPVWSRSNNAEALVPLFLAPAVTVGETEGAMDSTSGFFWPLLLPITM